MITFGEWEQRFAGIRFPSTTTELQCQSCGKKVLLYPKPLIRAPRILAYLLIPAIFPSIYLFALARRRQRAWTDNPVVEGAPWPAMTATAAVVMPLDERGSAPPHRRCACAAPAPCVRIELVGTWSSRVGTRYKYMCGQCGRRFTIASVRYLLTTAVLGAVLAAFGTLLIVDPPDRAADAQLNRWFGGALALLGTALLLSCVHRYRVRLAHPIVQIR